MILENNKHKQKAGFLFPYKNQKLSIKELAEKAGCSTSIVHECVKNLNEDPVKFVARIKRKNLLRSKK